MTASYGAGSMRPNYTSCSEHWKPLEEELESSPLLPTPAMKPVDPSKPSPFLTLPAEIRLQIYSLLVLPKSPLDLLPSYERVSSSTQDYYDYEKKKYGTDRPATADLERPTLLFRTIDPLRYAARYPEKSEPHARYSYSVRCDRFRARCMKTTYHCVNNPGIAGNLGLLGANKQIHAEAAELLYSHYCFDFDTHIEAMQPFLSDLTAYSRSCIRSTRFVKRALAYEKEFDRCEWANALSYINAPNSGIFLRRLELGVVAGRPGEHGWDRIARYTAADFNLLKEMENMEWLRSVLEMRELRELQVAAVIEHCPPATNSMAMAGYIRFSASIEHGFAQFLRSALIKA